MNFEDLVSDQGEVALVITDDNGKPHISAYTFRSDPSIPLASTYLSACDPVPTFLSSLYTRDSTKPSATSSPALSSATKTSAFYSATATATATATTSKPPSTNPEPAILSYVNRLHLLQRDTTPYATFAATKKKYKPVALKTRPVLGTVPERFRIVRNITGDPLASMPQLPTNPGDYVPTGRYTQERKEAFDKAHDGDFLWPKERKLLHQFMCLQNEAFAWSDEERGCFKPEFFLPIEFPVIPHTPWVQKNIPIPPGLYNEVCAIIKRKIAAGVYEPSNSSYRSRWFCVVKKDGKSLRLVHSLEPLNKVTIQHSGVPPTPDYLAEQFAGRPCGGMFDLYVGYDERLIAESSRDLTTFQTPFGALRLRTLPMGWCNAVPIFHDDVTYILQPEIPDLTVPYIDDCPGKGPESDYRDRDGNYKTIPQNPGIR